MRHPHRTPQTSPQRPHHLLVPHLPTITLRSATNLTFSEHSPYHPPPPPHSLLTSRKLQQRPSLNETSRPSDARSAALFRVVCPGKASLLRRNSDSPTRTRLEPGRGQSTSQRSL